MSEEKSKGPAPPDPNKGQRQTKTRPGKQLPTDRVAFKRQMDVLRAYAVNGEGGRAVTNEQVAATVGMTASTVSLCNPFLADIQLLQRAEGGYVPSPDVMAFNLAFGWDADNAASKLAPSLEKTWFAAALLPQLKFTPRDEREAITTLAEACGAGKEYKAQLRLLLDYLEEAGLISRENGMVRYRAGSTSTGTVPAPASPPPGSPELKVAPPVQGLSGDRVIPIPLGLGKLVKVELPQGWDNKDLPRLLKMLELSLSDDMGGQEDKFDSK